MFSFIFDPMEVSLTKSSGFSFGFQKNQLVTNSDGTLDVTDDNTVDTIDQINCSNGNSIIIILSLLMKVHQSLRINELCGCAGGLS